MIVMATPTIGVSGVTDSREFNARLVDAEPVTLGSDHWDRQRRFLPDSLGLRWVNGKLVYAQMTGLRIKDSGVPYATMEREGVSFIDQTDRSYREEDGTWVSIMPTGLAEDAPRWVRKLVEENEPK